MGDDLGSGPEPASFRCLPGAPAPHSGLCHLLLWQPGPLLWWKWGQRECGPARVPVLPGDRGFPCPMLPWGWGASEACGPPGPVVRPLCHLLPYEAA